MPNCDARFAAWVRILLHSIYILAGLGKWYNHCLSISRQLAMLVTPFTLWWTLVRVLKPAWRLRKEIDMAIALCDLIDNPQKLADFRLGRQHCTHCDVMIQETLTGKRPTPKGDACSDCYYEQIGEGVEECPIATPGLRRG